MAPFQGTSKAVRREKQRSLPSPRLWPWRPPAALKARWRRRELHGFTCLPDLPALHLTPFSKLCMFFSISSFSPSTIFSYQSFTLHATHGIGARSLSPGFDVSEGDSCSKLRGLLQRGGYVSLSPVWCRFGRSNCNSTKKEVAFHYKEQHEDTMDREVQFSGKWRGILDSELGSDAWPCPCTRYTARSKSFTQVSSLV